MKDKSQLAHTLNLLGGHLYCIASEMRRGIDDTARPTRFGLSLGENLHVIVEIRPHEGHGSGWAPISDDEAKAPAPTLTSTERMSDGQLGARPDASSHDNPANVWDHVSIYDGTEGEPTALGPRGKMLYSGNRVGACNFFAEYCTDLIRKLARAE